jgi:hypothetical protein
MKKPFMERVEFVPFSTCWYWTGAVSSTGYGYVRYKGAMQSTHRVSYKEHVGQIPDGMFVCHSCDERLCVNPDHLWLGTNADNTRDKMKKNRHRAAIGATNGSAKLTDEQVREIRTKVATGQKQKVVADEYGVSNQHVSEIYRGIYRRTA